MQAHAALGRAHVRLRVAQHGGDRDPQALQEAHQGIVGAGAAARPIGDDHEALLGAVHLAGQQQFRDAACGGMNVDLGRPDGHQHRVDAAGQLGKRMRLDGRRRIDDQGVTIGGDAQLPTARHGRRALVAGDAVNAGNLFGTLSQPAHARALGVEIHEGRALAARREARREIARDGRFARAAFRIEDNDLLHYSKARGETSPMRGCWRLWGKVPRHEFVPQRQRSSAYEDCPLAIGRGQTISQSFIVAFMTEQLDPTPTEKVLEIGTGSGYEAAVLAELSGQVYTIEIVEELGRQATYDLKRLGYTNVHTRIGDGYRGWPEAAPFDAIIVTCAPDDVPRPLVEQLKDGGP